jgi:L-lysine 6-transaminase
MLSAFDFPDKETRDNFVNKGFENNVMFIGCGTASIRFRPALIMQHEDVDRGIEVIERILPSL